MPFNDITKDNWKEEPYVDLKTESWWDWPNWEGVPEQSKDYHGLFIPQIPRSLILRYTKKGDWVLDPLCGAGTSGTEAFLHERHFIGMDLNSDAVFAGSDAVRVLRARLPEHKVICSFLHGDALTFSFREIFKAYGEPPTLIILHPPYHNIIRFTDKPEDLSNQPTVASFLQSLKKLVGRMISLMPIGGHLAIVMGDIYQHGSLIPLGMHSVELGLSCGLNLRAINVKRTAETRGKLGRRALQRFRDLIHGTATFGHEYVLIFRKTEDSVPIFLPKQEPIIL